jgi:PIN domain nuclease of toxin-antitoxin system
MGRSNLILIDTHIWVWLHSDPEKLSSSSIERLKDADRIAISSLSIYETLVALEKGRLTSAFEPEVVVRHWLAALDVIRIPVSEEIAMLSRSLPFSHGDPFDRMIAATSVHEKSPLMTADRNLLQLDWLKAIPG